MPSLNTVIKQASRGADLYFVFRFLRLLTMKYEKTDAYKYGIIDKKGKPLKKSSELQSVDEKAAYTMLHRLVFKVRRLIEKVPVLGKSILLNYAAALFLLKEQNDTRIWTDERYMGRKLMEFLENGDWEKEAELLREELKGQYGAETNEFLIEDGHTDVASAKNQVKIARSALQKMEMELSKLSDEEDLPTWWTNKVAVAVDNLDGMADYLDTQVEAVLERKMTAAEIDKREKIVLSLKKQKDDFKKRYGDEWKDVMYATATKMAMESFYGKVTPATINSYMRGLSRLMTNKELEDHLKQHFNLKKIKFDRSFSKVLAVEEREMKDFTEFQEDAASIDTKRERIRKQREKMGLVKKKSAPEKKEKDSPIRRAAKKAGMSRSDRKGLYNQNEVKEKKKIQDEEIANSVGGGGVAGLDIGLTHKKKKEDEKKVKALKKKMKIDEEVKVSTFAGKQVFVVDSDTYHQCRLGKKQYARYEKYVGKNNVGLAIREYGLKFPKRPIILQNGENGPMLYLRYGRS
jgi:hypothetical protein